MIRDARAEDIPALMKLLEHGYKRSRYADLGDIVTKAAEQLLLGMIVKHASKGIDGTWCRVIDREHHIIGMHFGGKQRVYRIGSKLEASDVFFYCKPEIHYQESLALLNSFIEWCKEDPRVIEIVPGVVDTVQPWEKAARIYELAGFEQAGAIFRRAA